MKNSKIENKMDELRPEYEFDYSEAIRGKYYHKIIKEGSNIIVLEPDVSRSFPDSASVNAALRHLMEITDSIPVTSRSRGRTKNARE